MPRLPARAAAGAAGPARAGPRRRLTPTDVEYLQSYAEGFRRFDLDECDRIVSEARREGRPVSEAFTPERLHAYFADTVPRRRRTALREGR